MITLSILAAGGAVRHGFFTREGGVSAGIFASLNCGFGSGDDPALVARNRALAMGRLGLDAADLATCRQVHSAAIVAVEKVWDTAAAPRADGMVTRRAGIALGVLAADCAPLLFADPDAGVVGAAHGGWRGALGGVAEAAVAGMIALGARAGRIRAGIGPCIAQPSYEVGPEFVARFAAADPASLRFFAPAARGDRRLFDLPGYLEYRLSGLGLAGIERAACDTAADADRFFSYRRACRSGDGDYGRALAAIALAA